MSKYNAEQLHDHIAEESSITCSGCRETDIKWGPADYTTDDFFRDGWRATKHGNVYCPACAAKKLK